MAEDPAYAEEKGLPLNYEYYLTNCLVKPLATILDLFVAHGKAEDILFGDIIRKYKMKRAGDRPSGGLLPSHRAPHGAEEEVEGHVGPYFRVRIL